VKFQTGKSLGTIATNKGEKRMSLQNLIETDVLVIGGGIAGCFVAITAREQGLNVTLVDKAYAGKSGASIAAGMGYMVFNPEWGLDLNACMNAIHIKGEYLNNCEWTEIVFKDSWKTYQDLVSWGVEFPVEEDTPYVKDLLPFGVVRIKRRKTAPVLRQQAVKRGVKMMDRIMVTDLLKQDGEVVGAIGFPMVSNDLYVFKAKATVLSTGYNSFKPAGAEICCLTGDGEAMAYRAGAEITCKEFPDTGNYGMMPYPAWRGGRGSRAVFRYYTDAEGERIKTHYQYESDLTLDFAVHAGRGPILWDLDAATPEDVERTRKRLQHSDALESQRMGFDPGRGGKIPQAGGGAAGAPNAQTGGIWPINTKCATSLPGLYVAGECCGTRYLGAYHPAPGFGLTGSAVTGSRAGLGAAEYALQTEMPSIDMEELSRLKKRMVSPMEHKGGFSPRWVTQVLQNTMIPYFILHIKHEKRLQAALTIVEFLRDHLTPKLIAKDHHELRLAHETNNMVLNAEMILRASLFRTESRGQHYREDYPRRDDPAWLVWVKMREEQGRMKLLKEPIPKDWWPDLSKPYEERYPKRFPGE
jgi:succinate dehydrogenase/fumarate reductase flavoprotein subunit